MFTLAVLKILLCFTLASRATAAFADNRNVPEHTSTDAAPLSSKTFYGSSETVDNDKLTSTVDVVASMVHQSEVEAKDAGTLTINLDVPAVSANQALAQRSSSSSSSSSSRPLEEHPTSLDNPMSVLSSKKKSMTSSPFSQYEVTTANGAASQGQRDADINAGIPMRSARQVGQDAADEGNARPSKNEFSELKSRHVAQTARSTARSRQARSSNAAVAHGHMEVIGKARPPEHNPIDAIHAERLRRAHTTATSCKLGQRTIHPNDASIQLKSQVRKWCDNPVDAENDYGPIADWDVSRVNVFDYLFAAADPDKSSTCSVKEQQNDVTESESKCKTSQNQTFNLSAWNTASAVCTNQMFRFATAFNSDLSKWKMGNVLGAGYMFEGASAFNADIKEWDTSSLLLAPGMFKGAAAFNSDLSKWNTANVKNHNKMFMGARAFDSDLSRWNVESSKNMADMFNMVTLDFGNTFKSDLSKWNTARVADMSRMFRYTDFYNSDMSKWDVELVIDMTEMFANTNTFGTDIGAWKVSSQASLTFKTMFYGTTEKGCVPDPPGLYAAEDGRVSIGRIYCNHERYTYCDSIAQACTEGYLKDGQICSTEPTEGNIASPDAPHLCDGSCRGGRCCDRSAQDKLACAECTIQGTCFNPPTVSEAWKTTALVAATEEFPLTMLGSGAQFMTIDWRTAINESAPIMISGESNDEDILPSELTYELKWLPAGESILPGYAGKFTVGGTPPADFVYDDEGPGGVGMDSVTGKVFAAPESNTANEYRTYTAWLIAVDPTGRAKKAGVSGEKDKVLLMEWNLDVTEFAAFTVDLSTFGREEGLTASKAKSCFFGVPCNIPKIAKIDHNKNPIDSSTASIAYTVSENSCSNDLDVMINPESGSMTASVISPSQEKLECEIVTSAIYTKTTGLKTTVESAELDKVVLTFTAEPMAPVTIALIAVAAVFAVSLIAFAGYKYRQYQISMRPVDFNAQLALMVKMGLIEAGQLKRGATPREIRRSDLTLGKVIGSGQFGEVYKAQLDESEINNIPEYTVAAKTVLDANESVEGTKEMLAEATVMSQVGAHPNLVSLVGIITRGDPLVLVISFCAGGSMLSVLKKQHAAGEPLSLADKLQMSVEVARGMEHIAKMHYIHRDLAARNVLVAEGLCKVADFGLSRGGGGSDDDEEGSEDFYKSSSGVFPVRWTAPEAMETMRFAPPTDVWSFGIVMVELLNDGETPYYGQNNPDVMKLTMSGGRHSKPKRCPDDVYKLMLECWDVDAAKRPTFTALGARLKIMAVAAAKLQQEIETSMQVHGNSKSSKPHAAKDYLFNCMLSYDLANIEMAKKIRNRLQELGFKVWYDAAGKIPVSAKAAVIENSEAFLYCMSSSYNDSEVCFAEANYAHQLKRPMLPLMCQKDYTCHGWLGFLLGTKLWYGICYANDKAAFNTTIDQVADVLHHLTSHKKKGTSTEPSDLSQEAIDYANACGTGEMLPSYDAVEAGAGGAGQKPKRQQSMKETDIESGKFNVMLSYCWAQQDLIKRIRAYLDMMGFVVWFDIEQMKGSVTDAMAQAVENSESIVYCMSQKYKESANCHSEANYAHQKKKPMIPLLVDADYTPDGWLGFLLGENKPLIFFGEIGTDFAKFEDQMDQLCHLLSECTSHSVDSLDGTKVDSYIKLNSAAIVGDGETLPEESTFEQEQNPRYFRAAGNDVYMQVEDPTANAGYRQQLASPSTPAVQTTESAYLQIGEAGAVVQKQNPLFAETGFGFGDEE